MSALGLIAAAVASTTAFGATPLPHEDYFSSTTTTCDAAWDGVCPVGWTGHGDNDSLRIVEENGDYAVRITPGSQMPNGISIDVEVDDAQDELVTSFLAWTHDGTATLVVRAVFKNSAGTTLSTQTSTTTAECPTSHVHELVSSEFTIPTGAVTATLLVGAVGGSGNDPSVEIATMVPFWIFLAGDAIPCPPANCNATISCPDGDIAMCICDPGLRPDCKVTDHCWCEDASAECQWEWGD